MPNHVMNTSGISSSDNNGVRILSTTSATYSGSYTLPTTPHKYSLANYLYLIDRYSQTINASNSAYNWKFSLFSTSVVGSGFEGPGTEGSGDLFIWQDGAHGGNGEMDAGVLIGGHSGYNTTHLHHSAARTSTGITFTGQHRCVMPNINQDEDRFGLIVSVKNNNIFNPDGSIIPTITDSVPVVKLTTNEKCKRVYGVVSGEEDYSIQRNLRMLRASNFKVLSKLKYENERRFMINSLGEGGIWVCNKNGVFECGDMITSSTVPGYGVLQDDDIMHNYTVGKISCDCEFSLEKIKKRKLLYTTDLSNNKKYLVYSDENDLQYEDDLDLSGNPIYEYPYDTRFLLPDGTILDTEEEYHSRKANGEEVFIACFVGCVYYCG